MKSAKRRKQRQPNPNTSPANNPSSTPVTQASSLRYTYLEALRNKHITAVADNGFWLKGKLENFDGSDLYILSTQYEEDNRERTVLNTEYAAIIPSKQAGLEELQNFTSGADDMPLLRKEFLSKLLGKQVVSIASCTGHRLYGDLISFDSKDLVLRTKDYGGTRYVLVAGYNTVYPVKAED